MWMVVKAAATEAAGAGHSKKCACCVETNAGSSSSQTWVSYLFNNGGKLWLTAPTAPATPAGQHSTRVPPGIG